MRWLDAAWWNHVRDEYPDRFAVCCGLAVAAVGLGGYASVSALGGGSATAGDYGVMGRHPAVTQPHSTSFALPTDFSATTLGGLLVPGLQGAPGPAPDGVAASSPQAGYVAAQGLSPHSPYRSSAPGSPAQPGAPGAATTPGVATAPGVTTTPGVATVPGVVTTVVSTQTQVSVTTTSAVTTTTAAATTTTQGGVTLPTPVTTVTVPLP